MLFRLMGSRGNLLGQRMLKEGMHLRLTAVG